LLNCIRNGLLIALETDQLELVYLSDQRRIIAFRVGQSETQITREIGSIFNAIHHRVVKAKDPAVVGSTLKEGATIITRYQRLLKSLNAAGIPAKGF